MPFLYVLLNEMGRLFKWALCMKHQSKTTKIHIETVADIRKDLLPNPDIDEES